MNLQTWFARGISDEQYIDSLEKHRDSFFHIYHHFTIPAADTALFKQKKGRKVLVLAEPWCGHCMLDIPILLKIVEQAKMPIRFLPRDEHLELMDQYVTDGKRYIPIVLLLDENGVEIAKWGPMAPEILQYVNELKTRLPEQNDPGYDQAFKHLIQTVGTSFGNDETLWNYVYEDMKKTIILTRDRHL